jgi:hypothetical protein
MGVFNKNESFLKKSCSKIWWIENISLTLLPYQGAGLKTTKYL